MRGTRGWLAALASLVLGACGTDTTEGPLVVPELKYGTETPWQEGGTSVPPPGAAGRLLITNSMDDTLSLLDLDGLGTPGWGELARVPVGLNPVELEGPHHSAVSPTGDFYYVGISNYVPGGGSGPHGSHGTGTVDGYCLKMDARTNQLVGSVRVDRNPGDLVLSADGKTLYQTHFDQLRIAEVVRRNGPVKDMNARLAIVDTTTMQRKAMVEVCPAPHAVRLSPDGRRAYVACWSDELAVVELEEPNHPVKHVKVAPNAGTAVTPRHQPYALTLSPASGAVWVSSLASRAVQYFDPVKQEMDAARTVYLSGAPMFGAITRDGGTLYMPYQGADALAVIDTATSNIRATIPLSDNGCLNVHQVELTPDERHGLVVCEGNHKGPGALLVVDLAEERVVKKVGVGIFPDSVTLLRRAP
ncbi:hypothetical protein P2318_32415 [Myxococcaceae bacterium GXIMD 01537]